MEYFDNSGGQSDNYESNDSTAYSDGSSTSALESWVYSSSSQEDMFEFKVQNSIPDVHLQNCLPVEDDPRILHHEETATSEDGNEQDDDKDELLYDELTLQQMKLL